MIDDNTKLLHRQLNLEITKNSFILGDCLIFDSDIIVEEITQNYMDYIRKIYFVTKKEFESANELFHYNSIRYKALDLIESKYFPNFSLYKTLFNRKADIDYSPMSQVKWFPTNDDEIERFISDKKPTMEFYKKLIMGYAPRELMEKLSARVPIYLSLEHFSIHSFIVGKSGYGKSVLMLEMMKSIIETKISSLILMEPNGDISLELAKLVNSDDLVYIDPFLKSGYTPTINIFDIGKNVNLETISIYTGIIVDVFSQILGSSFTPAMHSVLTPLVAVVLQLDGGSFFDLLRLLDDSNNNDILKYAQENALNPVHREYLKSGYLEKRASASKYSIYTKLQVLLNDPVFSSFLTGETTVDLENLMNHKRKIIIFRFNNIKMANLDAAGKFITGLITAYTFKREYINISKRTQTHFFIDEATMFINEKSTTILLEQARKYKLSMHLAAQNNQQLGTEINASILSNTNLKFVFGNSNKNHRIMSPEMGVKIDDLDAISKPGEVYCKVGANKSFKMQVSNTLLDKNLQMSDAEFEIVKERQLQKYYRKVDFSSVQYAKIPSQEKVKTTSHYTKETNQKLQESLMDSDDDILDF